MDVSVVVSTDGTNGLVSSVVCGGVVVVSTVEDGAGRVVSVDDEGKKLKIKYIMVSQFPTELK